MIRDATVLADVRQNWVGVEALRTKLQVSAFASISMGDGGLYPFALSNAAHNLPFIHAYAVLNEVLQQLADEGHFTTKTRFLGELLRKSKKALPWRDFALVKAGALRRNDVAHRGDLLNRDDCRKYVDAVKVELYGWGVL